VANRSAPRASSSASSRSTRRAPRPRRASTTPASPTPSSASSSSRPSGSEQSARLDPRAETTTLAWLRAARLHAYGERWAQLDEAAREALSRPDLKLLQQIEARGALALAQVSLGQLDEANKTVILARNQVEDHRLGEAGTPPLELAQLAFALGEVRRVKGESLRFVPVPADFGAALEARCTALLDAQNAYTEAMRSLDAHWSAMSGYRIGQLYAQLHADVMAVPTPKEATSERQKQLWEAAMRLRYRILLEKGLAMMDGTVRLGERTGERSRVDRTRREGESRARRGARCRAREARRDALHGRRSARGARAAPGEEAALIDASGREASVQKPASIASVGIVIGPISRGLQPSGSQVTSMISRASSAFWKSAAMPQYAPRPSNQRFERRRSRR
jgi:hypothetical protein